MVQRVSVFCCNFMYAYFNAIINIWLNNKMLCVKIVVDFISCKCIVFFKILLYLLQILDLFLFFITENGKFSSIGIKNSSKEKLQQQNVAT